MQSEKPSASPFDSERTKAEREQFDQLCFYTLGHGDPAFIHQHVVDAFAAQNAAADSKPIAVAFALFGLYLHLERVYTGREVQRAHMTLAQRHKQWPRFHPPRDRGTMTVADVLAAPPGAERDRAIDAWCASVWATWQHAREQVIELLTIHLPEHLSR
jgi:hypothetical protein